MSLALIDEATGPTSAPCAEGNAGACPVAKGETEGARCKFYSRWFEEEARLGADGTTLGTSSSQVLRLRIEHSERLKYQLSVESQTYQSELEAGAVMEHPVPAEATEATLLVFPAHYASAEEAGAEAITWTLEIVTDEASETTIEQATPWLNNLGYIAGEGDETATASAVASFQYDEGLPVTGEADEETLSKLHERANV